MTSRRWTSGRVPVEFSERMPTLTPDTSVRAAGRAVEVPVRLGRLTCAAHLDELNIAAQLSGGQAVPGPRRAFACSECCCTSTRPINVPTRFRALAATPCRSPSLSRRSRR